MDDRSSTIEVARQRAEHTIASRPIVQPQEPTTTTLDTDLLGYLTSHWFDTGAVATIAAFLVIGCWKGLRWQLGRLAILVLAYAVPFGTGSAFADLIRAGFPASADPALPDHVAHATLFLAVLSSVGLFLWLLRRAVEHRAESAHPPRHTSGRSPAPDPEDEPARLALGNRLAGGLAGGAAGALLVLAFLTFTQMFLGDGRIARAAEQSTSAVVGRRALSAAERVLPGGLAAGAQDWRRVLRDPSLSTAQDDPRDAIPRDGDFRRLDHTAPRDAQAPAESASGRKTR